MNFKLTRADREEADFNMMIELMATMLAMRDAMAELSAQRDGIDIQRAKEGLNKRVDTYRQIVLDKLDEDYGTVDLEELKTNAHDKSS